MRKVAYSTVALAFITLFAACKNEVDQQEPTNSDQSVNTLAVADIPSADNPTSTLEFLYVTAPSGLSLREYDNLNSDRLAKMPYGTKVRIITSEERPTMTVAGIKGAMNEVEFNHKTGFAFTGYLSKFFPPEQDITPKGYSESLKEHFPKVTYETSTGGTVSAPSNSETIALPTTQWHEAFFVAQQLFDFPKEFAFPLPKGKNEEVIVDKKPKKGIWQSELHVTRANNELQSISYVYKAQNFENTVTIVQDGDFMKISKTEVIK